MSFVEQDGFVEIGKQLGIQNVHLVSGEDIIGNVFVSGDKLVISDPVMPNVAMDPNNGSFRVGLLPLRPYLNETKQVEIEKSKVLYHISVGTKMEALYRQFTSNIVIATPGDIPNLPNLSLVR